MERSRIGFVVGLTAEAALLKDTGFMVGVGGGTPAGAAQAAARLIDKGAQALVSFGLAGGLDPALKPGDIVIPVEILDAGTVYVCGSALLAWLGKAAATRLFAAEDIAVTSAQKAALFANTGAVAVDLESGAVARIATQASIPFAVLRAVADPATRTLPPAALIALNAGGQISPLPILASVLRNPAQIPVLIALGGDAAKARRALVQKLKLLPQEL